MTTQKGDFLLKCDCERTKYVSEVHDKIERKYFCIRVVFCLLFVFTLVSFFVQYTLRINQLENKLREVEESLKEVMKTHADLSMLMDSKMFGPFEEEDDYDYVYQDYVDYSEHEPSTKPIKDGKHDTNAPINETQLMDTENRTKKVHKRSVLATIKDGVLINSEPYAENKAKNLTHKRRFNHNHRRGKSLAASPARPSTLGDPWPFLQSSYGNSKSEQAAKLESNPKQKLAVEEQATTKSSVSVRRSRVMNRGVLSMPHFRNVNKPLLKSGDLEYDSYFQSGEIPTTEASIVSQVNIGKHRKLARTRPLITIHFSGDTSKYVVGRHDNFNGNGHLRHLHQHFVDWTPSDWVAKTGMDSHFSLNQGVVTIKETGLYFVYAQVYYLDEHDTTGYRVFRNSDMILQCTITQHSSVATLKGNTCYTAGVEFLSAGDTVYLSDITPGKYSLFEPGKSFFGLVKLGDFRNK